MDKNKIRELLYVVADGEYKDFNSKIINTVDKDRFIGVRTPEQKVKFHARLLTDKRKVAFFWDS